MSLGSVLVTGASGFVGSELYAELKKQSCRVRLVVREKTYILSTDAEIAKVSSVDANTNWTDVLREIHVIIHLAARVHVMHDDALDPLAEFRKVNVEGTANLARQAARAGVKRFVYVSSIKVNGEQNVLPFTELDDPFPQDPYGVSKWEAEQVLREISKDTGMEVVIIRPPLVYGSGVKGNFASLLNIVAMSLPLPLSSVKNARSMVFVGNLVDAILVCAQHPKAAGQTYLVSDAAAVSTPQLIKLISKALNVPCRLFHFPVGVMRFIAKLFGRAAMVDRLTQSLLLDSQKIRNDLGWRPPFTLEQGLEITARSYLERKGRKSS